MLLLAFSPCFMANSPRSTLVSQVLAASFVGDLEVEQVEPVIIGPMKPGTTTAEKNGANSEWGKSPKYRIKMINSYRFFSMIEVIQQTIHPYTCFWYVFGMYTIKVRVARDFAIQIAGASNNRHEQNHVVKDRELLADSVLKVSGCDSCGFHKDFCINRLFSLIWIWLIMKQLPNFTGVPVEPPMMWGCLGQLPRSAAGALWHGRWLIRVDGLEI